MLTTGELRVPGERMGIMAIAGTAMAGQQDGGQGWERGPREKEKWEKCSWK